MGLIRYSCGHISGPHESIPTKFGLWIFFIMIHRYMVSKTLKCKKKFFVMASLLYSIIHMPFPSVNIGGTYQGCYRYISPCQHIGSKLCGMSIHYPQYTDTFSILNYLQNHRLWRKKQSKVGPLLSRKFQITYKIIICGEKNFQNWYYII